MKRSSPEGSDDADDSQTGYNDIASKKRRYCEFESVRLLSVSGVNDIEEKKSKVQVYKLSETLRHKDKIIAEKDREIERLRERQYTDENTSYTINRYWNNLDEQLRTILLRGSNPSEVQHLLETNGDTSNFLEEVVQMNEDERQKIYEKRINTSVRLLQQLLQNNCQRAEQLKAFTNKLNIFMTEANNRDDAFNETVHTNAILSDENSRLNKELTRLQNKYSDCKLKLREAIDNITQLETKNEEQTKEINDLKHDLNKSNRLVNKLDFKLWSEIKERRKVNTSSCESLDTSKLNGSNAHPGELLTETDNGFTSKQIEELRLEAESNGELAASRLTEINELNAAIRRQTEELQRAKLVVETPAIDNMESEQTKEVKVFLALLVAEIRRVTNADNSNKEEMELLREDYHHNLETTKQNYDRIIKKLQQMNEKLQKDKENLQSELETVRNDFDMAVKSIVSSGSVENKDIRTLKESFVAQIAQHKSECARMRKKWKESVQAYIKNSQELENEKKKNEKYYLVSIIPEDDKNDLEESTLKDIYHRLKDENNGLRQEIKRLKEMEESVRKHLLETQFKLLLDEKDSKIVALNQQIENLKQGDESITQEMESIGQALEDLQEQNTDLIRRAQHHEEEKMKMMGDKISSSQIETKLREEKVQLDVKVDHIKHQIQAAQSERQHLEDTQKTVNTALSCKMKEASILRCTVEMFKKQTLEKAVELSQLKADKEKLTTQVKSMQETVISKNQQHDIITQKVRRLEEENSMVKKKLDRLKRCEKLGSTDAVMSEEIRQLKEALTCPSCKVNRKDAILTKCFHVFCMKCIKTRYDTRQRKCPKCNAGFGANDFQRAYIG